MSSIRPVAVVTGASAGLGLAIAKTFLQHGFDVVGIGRSESRLQQAAELLTSQQRSEERGRFIALAADVADPHSVNDLFARIHDDPGRIDVLVNCVGKSDRGTVASLSPERLVELFDANVITTLLCSQAALPLLKASAGVVVNIGSLASKVGARHLGGYPAVKHALAGLTQQMRLEWREFGIHVALLSPGPIRRDDEGQRYDHHLHDGSLPASAMKPGGGTSIRGIEAAVVADHVLRCAKRRTPDVMLPGYSRLLVTVGHLCPRLGDWLLLRMTRKA
ncbi:MAG: SDR family NAD(P)-dependent oxidoreductase [Planctomycetaceae bacterium]